VPPASGQRPAVVVPGMVWVMDDAYSTGTMPGTPHRWRAYAASRSAATRSSCSSPGTPEPRKRHAPHSAARRSPTPHPAIPAGTTSAIL